ncbi:MAG: YkgJ family cysteine cluster protein [Thermoplasmata archaeon]|nr:YkgJ family cysteine cluster protein [Thermoplasmata archaeon]
MKRFSCQRCGACCNNIQGNFKEEEIREIKMAFKKLENQGIYLAVKPENFSIPLFPHEAKKMRELASKIGIDFFPVPKLFMIDSKTGYCIVLEWDLGYSNCPFFDNDKCLIHNDRPLACQSFPIFPYSFSSSPEEYILLGRCPQSKDYDGLNKEEKEIIFEREIEAVLLYSKELRRYKKMKDELITKGLLVPLIMDKREAIKRMKEAEKEKRLVSIDEFVNKRFI